MIKKLISRHNEDAGSFLQCACGSGVIWSFYYKPTVNCEEIIGLTYFGQASEEYKSLCKVTFTFKEFINYFEELRNCYYIEDDYSSNLVTSSFIINFIKADDGYTKINLTKDQKTLNKNIYAWSICIRNKELKEYLDELSLMLTLVKEEHLDVKASN